MVQSGAIPLAVTLIACGLIRLAGGSSRGRLIAGAAVSIGFLAAYVAISGVPAFPPRASSQKLFYLVPAAVVIGLALDLLGPGRRASGVTILAALGLGIAWLAWPKLRTADPVAVVTVALVWIAAGVPLIRLHAIRGSGSDGAVLLFAAALGLAAIAFLSRTASYAQLGAAFAAATGGFLLWNWPVVRFPFGAAAVLGAGGAFMAMAANIFFYTKASPISMLCLFPVFFVDLVADRLPLPRVLAGQPLRPFVLLAFASIPLGAAVAIGALTNG
jgi:hypothetical protein